jgi:hypothetical protein
MELIDWPAVARNALWLLGLSVALAAWSHSSWWAAVHGQPFRSALDRPAFSIPFSAGLLLFSTSLAWGATRGWARLLWVGLALWFAWELVAGVRRVHDVGQRRA